MTSALVLLICSLVHLGLRKSCFVEIDCFPAVQGMAVADHIAYVTMLYIVYDLELLPLRYKFKMFTIVAFLMELILGIALIEVCIMCLWSKLVCFFNMCAEHVLARGKWTTVEESATIIDVAKIVVATMLLITTMIGTNTMHYAASNQLPNAAKKVQQN